jgi:GNAT superfamily N-acetyltransferase
MDKPKIKIQKAKLSDLNDLMHLTKKLMKFEEKHDPHYSTSADFERTYKAYLKKKLKSRNFVVLKAVCNGKIVGEIIGEIQEKLPYRKLKKFGYIERLFVAEPYRNTRIATKLVEKLSNWFKRKRIRHMEVVAISKNKDAIRFYKKRGFSEIHRKFMLPVR